MILNYPNSTINITTNLNNFHGVTGTIVNATAPKTIFLCNRSNGYSQAVKLVTDGLNYTISQMTDPGTSIEYFVVGLDPLKVVNGAIADRVMVTVTKGITYVYQQ